jgi:hypothetical protein
MVVSGFGWRWVAGVSPFVLAAVIFGLATGEDRAWAARNDDVGDSRSGTSTSAPSDADLMYRAMKRSRQSKDDVAIDRALARAKADSERRKQSLRESASSWKDPFAEDSVGADRDVASTPPSRGGRPVSKRSEEELKAARAEAARARWEAASARADAAVARAEAAGAKADAARAEAAAARAQFVARTTCAVGDAPKKARYTTTRGPRDESRGATDWMPAMRRAVVHTTAARRASTSVASPPALVTPAPAPAPVPQETRSAPLAAAPSAPSRSAPATGIIVVPIPPPPQPERARR